MRVGRSVIREEDVLPGGEMPAPDQEVLGRLQRDAFNLLSSVAQEACNTFLGKAVSAAMLCQMNEWLRHAITEEQRQWLDGRGYFNIRFELNALQEPTLTCSRRVILIRPPENVKVDIQYRSNERPS